MTRTALISHRKPSTNDEEVIEAATTAGVHTFIVDLPDGHSLPLSAFADNPESTELIRSFANELNLAIEAETTQ